MFGIVRSFRSVSEFSECFGVFLVFHSFRSFRNCSEFSELFVVFRVFGVISDVFSFVGCATAASSESFTPPRFRGRPLSRDQRSSGEASGGSARLRQRRLRQLRLRRGAGPAAAAPAAAAPAAALWVPTQAPGFPGSRGVGPANGWCSGGSLPGDASHAKEMKGRRMLGCESMSVRRSP